MSPHRQQRRMAWTLVAGVVAVVALVVSVWAVGDQAASDIHNVESRARAVQTGQLRAGCARGVARDFEAMGTNEDLRDFARDAAKARRADGNIAVARRYDATADRAELRMQRIALRVPAHEDEASIQVYCRDLYPAPSG